MYILDFENNTVIGICPCCSIPIDLDYPGVQIKVYLNDTLLGMCVTEPNTNWLSRDSIIMKSGLISTISFNIKSPDTLDNFPIPIRVLTVPDNTISLMESTIFMSMIFGIG